MSSTARSADLAERITVADLEADPYPICRRLRDEVSADLRPILHGGMQEPGHAELVRENAGGMIDGAHAVAIASAAGTEESA